MNKYNREDLASLIFTKLVENKDSLKKQWLVSNYQGIGYFFIDDVLPKDIAQEIYNNFPKSNDNLALRKSLRELKYVSSQMNDHAQILEESLFAFQDERIVEIVEEITELKSLEPDELLYAGGVSLMGKGHFLNPHLDNSHDKDRDRYRVLNLLYYVNPDWQISNGGNLELWPNGVDEKQITIESKFNRLVVMVTHQNSWHSVSPIMVDKMRCCISNYYFSKQAVGNNEYFHITSFRGRPEQKVRDLILKVDTTLRMLVRKIFPRGAVKTTHFYKK